MDKTKRIVVDTNLLIRYLVNDDSRKAQIVDTLLKKARKGEIHILMPSVVVAELVWVLESFYKMETAEIADLVDSILNTPGLTVSDDSIVRSALKRYKTKGVDLVDAWIAAFAQDKGANEIHTFDKKHFKGIDDITVVQP
ncbi:MAG TPA: type II toxin-antitoxin system VapC family toxin [Thermodesulfovibrionales bacterium]|nr:type II toxin-antitoxin system VapC family toxin [Thermodesulfovibrionales bacterium]